MAKLHYSNILFIQACILYIVSLQMVKRTKSLLVLMNTICSWLLGKKYTLEHISQSIGDILRTPVGSRVMRRDYGSLLASMIDQPQTPALELQIKVACYMAVLKWEPRVTLSSVTTERSFDGRMTVTLTGQHNDTGQPLSLTIPVS